MSHDKQPFNEHLLYSCFIATPIRKTCDISVGAKLHFLAWMPHKRSLPHSITAQVSRDYLNRCVVFFVVCTVTYLLCAESSTENA